MRRAVSLDLIDELWALCFSFLTSANVAQAQLVSRRWHQIGRLPMSRLVARVGPLATSLSAAWLQDHRCVLHLTLRQSPRPIPQFTTSLQFLHASSVVIGPDWHLPAGLQELVCQAWQGEQVMPRLRRLHTEQAPSDLQRIAPILEHCTLDVYHDEQRSWPLSLRSVYMNGTLVIGDALPSGLIFWHTNCMPRLPLPASLQRLSLNLTLEDSWALGQAKTELDVMMLLDVNPDVWWGVAGLQWLAPQLTVKCLMLSQNVLSRLPIIVEDDGGEEWRDLPAFVPVGVEWIVAHSPTTEAPGWLFDHMAQLWKRAEEVDLTRVGLAQEIQACMKEQGHFAFFAWSLSQPNPVMDLSLRYFCGINCNAWRTFGPCSCLPKN